MREALDCEKTRKNKKPKKRSSKNKIDPRDQTCEERPGCTGRYLGALGSLRSPCYSEGTAGRRAEAAKGDLERAMKGHILAQSELIGRFKH